MDRFDLGTFSVAGCEPFACVVVSGRALALSALRDAARAAGHPLHGAESLLAFVEDWDSNLTTLQRLLAASATHPAWLPIDQLNLHAPLIPRQILCSGANYKKHVVDLIVDQGGGPATAAMGPAERRVFAEKMMEERVARGTPYVFTKLPSSLVGAHDPIVLPARSKQTDWELELAVVISRPAWKVSRADAHSFIAGYTIVNDMTNRDFVFRDDMKALGTDWLSSKSSPGFTPIGPYLTPAQFVADPQALQIVLKLNGEAMQDETTADMIFDVARLIEYTSSIVRLLPGDVLLTGSPAGNGTHYNRYLEPGDVLEGSITGIGTQSNLCVEEASTSPSKN